MLDYHVYGSGEECLVFIHGLGSKKEFWNRQIELSEKFTLVTLDLHCHGESDDINEINIENLAKGVIDLLDYLKIKKSFICGLSLGGIVTQEIYKQRPQLVKGLVLSNTCSYIPKFIQYVIPKKIEDISVEKIIKRSLYHKKYANEAKNYFHIRNSYLDVTKSAIGVNYYSLLPDIHVPVLLIGSVFDNVVPLFNQLNMKQYIKNSKIEIFYKSSHLSNIEETEKFNKILSEFIEKNSITK